MITLDNLSIDIQGQVILDQLTMTIERGDYLAIVGPNGSGKSTLLKCLNGIIKTHLGQVSLDSHPIHNFSPKQLAQHISYVPQSTGKQLPFIVEDFIKMSRYPHHSALSEWQQMDTDAVEEALSITNTQAFRHRQLQTLSGGEAQRVMIAAALCQQAEVMLLDEPSSYLDPHHQIEVHRLITRLNQQHKITIIEVTHDINHASHHAKHVLALKAGKILWLGDARDFLNTDRLYQLYQQDFVLMQHPHSKLTIALADQ